MSLNINEIRPFLDALVGTDHVYESLKTRYPQMLADIVSSKENPNCGCRNRLSSFLVETYNNPEEKLFIDNILNDKAVLEKVDQIRQIAATQPSQVAQHPVDQLSPKDINNIKKYTLNKSQASWEDFSAWVESKQIQFKSFSVVDKGNELDIYFL